MPEPPENRRSSEDPPPDPRQDALYRMILAVLAASVIVGALVTLTGEALFGSRALANAGLGMAVLCLALYWVFRLLGRRAARRREKERD
ncbi:hypothetical protein AAFN88_02975 [Pelagibius sp. CAU 1746]|uniref:hypothetical protein n=1 Tax=Pelagibius sp. CAU 1746 TaxID=3140370 RepID=UPI00325A6CD1